MDMTGYDGPQCSCLCSNSFFCSLSSLQSTLSLLTVLYDMLCARLLNEKTTLKQHLMQFLEQPTHDVVYLNEEGRWVTDLAYYTSFNKEQVFNLANTDEDFITGCKLDHTTYSFPNVT